MLDFIYELRDDLGPAGEWARSTEDVTVGADIKPVTGCQLTLGRTGRWLIVGCYTVAVNGDQTQTFTGTLRHQGETRLEEAVFVAPTDLTTVTVSQAWLVEASANDVVAIEIVKDGGAGTSVCQQHNCTISAVWGGR
jgi:hypothetical protein